MNDTRQLASKLREVANEMQREEGCITQDPALLKIAGAALQWQQEEIQFLRNLLTTVYTATNQPRQPLAAATPAKPSVFNGVFHEAPYTARVVRPIRGRADRTGVLPVEVYAIGAGITVSRERSDLTGRQGAFELEANGKFFVFDMLSARKTNWFVSVVERDIAAIWQQIKAMDEVEPPQGRDAFLHACSSQKTCIVTLPQGIGKTTLASALAVALGCHTIVDDWGPGLTVIPGALHLTSDEVPA